MKNDLKTEIDDLDDENHRRGNGQVRFAAVSVAEMNEVLKYKYIRATKSA